MSYIDSFDHELIGHLGYLPLYRSLQDIPPEGDASSFSATPEDLILGGGGGEHPALVVSRMPTLVARFLLDQLNDEELHRLGQADREYVDDLYYAGDVLRFCQWRVSHYADLQAMAQSPALRGPLTDGQDVEDWIEKSLGELVYYALPELNPEHARLKAIFGRFDIRAEMGNVSVVPPGYPACGGRKRDNDRVVWGNRRWPTG